MEEWKWVEINSDWNVERNWPAGLISTVGVCCVQNEKEKKSCKIANDKSWCAGGRKKYKSNYKHI